MLALLQREGPVSADSLAEKLNLTGMAVRLHLGALLAEGLAAFAVEARPRGRPVQMWSATAKAAAQFADSHSALAVDLIVQMKKAFGDEGMDRILKLRTAEQEKAYRAKTDTARSLKGKLDQLAKIRTAEGYMAEVRRDAETGDGCSSRTIARSAPPRGCAPGSAARSSRCSIACWARTSRSNACRTSSPAPDAAPIAWRRSEIKS